MKMIKQAVQWWKRSWGHKYINGGRGVISIFLACLMLPFLTLADYMVETARYHEAVQILSDAIDSGNLSVLANYDQYLFDRFGIMAVSQAESTGGYTEYINSNLSGIDAWQGVKASEELQYPLSDPNILKRQVLEVSKFSSPVALANDMALSQLIAKLESINDSVKIMTNLLDSYAKLADSSITTVKGADKLNKCATKLPELERLYYEKYEIFELAVQSLLDYEVPEADEEGDNETSDTDSLQQLEEEYEAAKQNYLTAISNLREGLNDYHQSVSDMRDNTKNLITNASNVAKSYHVYSDIVSSSAISLDRDIAQLNNQIANAPADQRDALEKQRDALKTQSDMIRNNADPISSAAEKACNSYQSDVNDTLKSYDEVACNSIIERLDTCSTNVSVLSQEMLQADYEYEATNFYIPGENLCATAGIEVLKEVVQDELEGNLLAVAKAASAAIKNLFTTSTVFDCSLDAVVTADMLQLDAESGWIDVMNAFQKLSDDLNNLVHVTGGILGVLQSIKSVISDAIDLIEAIVKIVSGMVVRAIESVAEIVQGQAGEKILISEYLTKSMANRTNYKTGKDLFTGYSFSKVKFTNPNVVDGIATGSVGTLSALISTLRDLSKGGEDKIFCGAELEYILVGSSMEIANQAGVFLQIYLMRLVLDAVPVMMNKEVQAMSEAAGAVSFGVGTAVVYIAELFIQPLIETISIVNGTSINLWNTIIYLTPSGIMCAIGHFTKFKMTDGQKEELKHAFGDVTKDMKEALPDGKDNDGYTWDYDNYCFVLLMLIGETDTVMNRLANVMYMEANAYYGEGKFDIKKTYTCVTGTVSGNYQIILPFDRLSDTGFGEIIKSRSRSY